MKAMLVLSIVGVVATIVSAHGGGGGGDRRGPGWPGGNWRGYFCRCSSATCNSNTGLKNIGCIANRTAYIQCQDATCSIQSCPAGQLFNYTSLACEACATGFHVDATNRTCTCNRGTTLDRQTRTCTACPTAATLTDDYCYCNKSVYTYVKAENACKVCPADSTLRGGCCKCNDSKAFWNSAAFQCQQCPGQWVNKTSTVGGFRRSRTITNSVCECQTAGQVFNKYLVSCVTCPTDSVVSTSSKGESYCLCSQPGYKYYERNNTCIERRRFNSHESDDECKEFSFKDIFGFGSSEEFWW